MAAYLCISVRFLQPYSHGRDENGEPEWPPSPLRVFQAIVAASAARWNEGRRLQCALPALQWLEAQSMPEIVAAGGVASDVRCQFYVPDNTADLVVPAWRRGDITKQARRTEKVVRPMHLAGDHVHYLYPLPDGHCPYVDKLTAAVRSITHLGWGVDMVVADARTMLADEMAALDGYRWRPAPAGGTPLRVPAIGTLDDLMRKHEAFLNRLSSDGFRPVPPLRTFRVRGYRRDDQLLQRPYRVFELRRTDGSRFRYPHRKLIHIAGMVRHLAIKAMKTSPPTDLDGDWVDSYVAGHAPPDAQEHRQLSYLPLPSVGVHYTDPGVRRVMIVAPVGDDAWLDHVARYLAGQMLEPLRGDEFVGDDRPLLVPVRHDNIARYYTTPANAWASVTPVILPGHDDKKPAKTRKLIEKALAQAGIEQSCQFEWSAFSRFPKSLSAHKYDKQKRPIGYIRPKHLQTQTAVHLTLRFNDDVKVPGPIAIGAGRHCGLGLFAAEPTT
jgi:CRISPR-associated protein Csb2